MYGNMENKTASSGTLYASFEIRETLRKYNILVQYTRIGDYQYYCWGIWVRNHRSFPGCVSSERQH